MQLLLSNTVAKVLCTGSETSPLDIIVQNISANTVYVSFQDISSVANNGIKIAAGGYYSNNQLTKSLYALADVDASEIRFEVQNAIIPVKRFTPS